LEFFDEVSFECVLVYVLRRSGCVGRLSDGHVERRSPAELNVYDRTGGLTEYISGDRTRSWCLLGPDNAPIEGWSRIHPEDALAIQKTIA